MITINLIFFFRKRRKSNLCLNRPKKIGKYYTTQRSITNDVKMPISTAKNPVSSPTLLQAPKKKTVVAGKKKLFDNCETLLMKLVKIIPNIVTRLRKEGMLAEFDTFLRLINEDKFLLNNISFLLLVEVSRWYSLQTTT